MIMSTDRIPADRRKLIIEQLQEEGIVRVNELSDLFSVSVLTVRRDLDLLEKQGVLERTHGGAVLRQNMPKEPLFSQKLQARKGEKERIAAAAAQLIDDGDTVFINSGSTTRAVINALAKRDITIITNNIGAAYTADEGSFTLIITGGLYRTQSNAVTGEFGLKMLENVYANKAIIGVDGFSLTHGLTTPVLQEAEMTRRMIEKTVGKIIVVADSSKIGVVSNFKTVDVREVDYVVTDRKAEGILSRKELEQVGITLLLADE